MCHRTEQNVALAGVGPGLVDRQPDGVGPAVGGGRLAARGGAALVGHLVVDADARAVYGLVGCHHIAGHQIGKRHRLDIELDRARVVGLVRVLIDVVVAVGHHDQISVAAIADRDVDRGALIRITLGGRERCAAGKAPHQQVVAAVVAVQRQVDAVHPLARGCGGPQVADRITHRRAAPGDDPFGRRHRHNPQIRAIIQPDLEGAG